MVLDSCLVHEFRNKIRTVRSVFFVFFPFVCSLTENLHGVLEIPDTLKH